MAFFWEVMWGIAVGERWGRRRRLKAEMRSVGVGNGMS